MGKRGDEIADLEGSIKASGEMKNEEPARHLESERPEETVSKKRRRPPKGGEMMRRDAGLIHEC